MKKEKSFGEMWVELTKSQRDYFTNYIDNQMKSAVEFYKKQNIINKDSDEWFAANLIALADSELALVKKGIKEKVDKDMLCDWIKSTYK